MSPLDLPEEIVAGKLVLTFAGGMVAEFEIAPARWDIKIDDEPAPVEIWPPGPVVIGSRRISFGFRPTELLDGQHAFRVTIKT